jgi:hypothetical protein
MRVAAGGLDVLADRLRDVGEQVLRDEALAGVRRFYSQYPYRIELLSA